MKNVLSYHGYTYRCTDSQINKYDPTISSITFLNNKTLRVMLISKES